MGMLSVRHRPLSGDVPAGELAVDAEIIAYSGEALLEDALHLIYRTGDAPYDTLALARTDADTFRATLPTLPVGAEVSYYLSASDASGRTEHFPLVGPDGPRTFRIAPPVAADADAPLAALRLDAAPNPARGATTLRYTLAEAASVTLDVYDALGRRVARLHSGPAASGEHRVTWDASGAPAGVYLVRLTGADGARGLRRVTVAR